MQENVVQRLLREQAEQKAASRTAVGCLKAVGTALMAVSLLWWRPFVVMLALGMVHDRFPVVPVLGFWETWVVLFAASVVFGRGDWSATIKGLRGGDKSAGNA